MTKLFTTIFLLLLFTHLNSQVLSEQEAYTFASKLHEVKILSDRGLDFMRNKIGENNFERDKKPNWDNGYIEVNSNLSTSQILILLQQAFLNDYYYRSGMVEYSTAVRKFQEDGEPMTKERLQEFEAKLDSIIQNSPGFKIEDKIQDEDNFPNNSMRLSIPSFLQDANEYDLISHHRSVMGKTCSRTLRELLDIGLINKTVFNEVNSEIKKHKLPLEAYLIAYTAERVIFYEDFKENKSKELNFIKSLNENGIISDRNLELLTSGSDTLLTPYDLIKYSERAKVFHVKDYSTDPAIGYKAIFEEIKSIIPDFEFSRFKVEIEEVKEQWSSDMIEYEATISLEVAGTKYSNTFFYDYQKRDVPSEPTLLKINNDMHKSVNKYLADQNSDYRLYYANKKEKGKGVYGESEFGLILLTEKQFQAWGGTSLSYFLFRESHDNRFNSKNINNIVETYKKIGLFKHLTEAEINSAKNCVKTSEIQNYQDILLCFPKTVIYFDWETGNLENPYEELTSMFADASRGVFTPTNIVDDFKLNWDKKATNYSFRFGGKLYEQNLDMKSDWLDPQFMGLIEQALKENGTGLNLHFCLDNGQATGFIFLDDHQYEFLKKNQKELFPER